VLVLGACGIFLRGVMRTETQPDARQEAEQAVGMPADESHSAQRALRRQVTEQIRGVIRQASEQGPDSAASEETEARALIAQGLEAQPVEVQRRYREAELTARAAHVKHVARLANQLARGPQGSREALAPLQAQLNEHNAAMARARAELTALAVHDEGR
jgi:hypothetical protein